MQKKSLFILLLTLCFELNLVAQIDTTLFIPEVEIFELKIREDALAASKLVWDSAQINQKSFLNLSEFLQEEGNVFIKTYGGNSLSTMSIRGSSASQSLVLWNGLPIQSPMLGQLDLSLIPLDFNNKIELQFGGNSSLWGSGAVGGVLALSNESAFDSKFNLQYKSSIGSFSRLNQQLKLGFGTDKFQSASHLIYQNSQNDFSYKPDPALPLKRLSHAAFQQLAFMQNLSWKINKHHHVSFFAWWQEVNREIPPTLTQASSLAKQEDQFTRVLGSWKAKYARFNLETKLAYFIEKQAYDDPQVATNNNNDFNTFLAELNLNYKFSKKHLLFFANTHNQTLAFTQSYKQVRSQYRMAFLTSYQFLLNDFRLQLGLRAELVGKKCYAPTAFLGMEVDLTPSLLLKAKISRDYRVATLNDLFWLPGGNENLKAEQGFSEDIGLRYSFEKEKHKLVFEQNFYNRNINDWILWVPSTNAAFWQSNNIAKVWSWGSESSLKYQFTQNNWQLSPQLLVNYTSSTYRIDLSLPIIKKGDQLLYTPKYQCKASVKVQYDNFRLTYQHNFTGAIQGANERLRAYQLANAHFEYFYNAQKTSGSIFLSINNIFNQSYFIVERRPMPGINYQVGINFRFNH